MRKLGILLVLAGVGYLVYTQGLPKYRAHREATEAAETDQAESSRCVAAAEQSRDMFVSEIGQLGPPPIESDIWTTAMLRMGGQLSSAYDACSCPTRACLDAGAALSELRDLLDELDGFVRGKSSGIVDPGGRLQHVGELLELARAGLD
jgi:hypothetical protein